MKVSNKIYEEINVWSKFNLKTTSSFFNFLFGEILKISIKTKYQKAMPKNEIPF
jgi:hypothetical protein